MTDLGISINLNLAACWLKLGAYETASQHYTMVLQFDLFNVKVRYRRSRSFLGLGKVDKAHNDIIVALRFDPQNGDVLSELSSVEQLCRLKTNSTPLSTNRSKGKETFNPLKFHFHPPSLIPRPRATSPLSSPLLAWLPWCPGVFLPWKWIPCMVIYFIFRPLLHPPYGYWCCYKFGQ